jgi:hypothetical protein
VAELSEYEELLNGLVHKATKIFRRLVVWLEGKGGFLVLMSAYHHDNHCDALNFESIHRKELDLMDTLFGELPERNDVTSSRIVTAS